MRWLERHRRPVRRGPAEDPILAGRGAFAGAFADLARGKRTWQVVAFGLLGVLGLVVAGFVRVASESRVTPYVVEVDKLGRAASFGPAEPAAATDPRIVEATLALFLRNVRAISSDGVAQREFLYRGYATVRGRAREVLDAYFAAAEHDPRVLGRSLTRTIEVNAVLPVPGSSVWRAQWTEHERPLFVGLGRDTAWEAYLTVTIQRPRTAAVLEENPLGIYVSDLTWTELTPSSSPANGGVR